MRRGATTTDGPGNFAQRPRPRSEPSPLPRFAPPARQVHAGWNTYARRPRLSSQRRRATGAIGARRSHVDRRNTPCSATPPTPQREPRPPARTGTRTTPATPQAAVSQERCNACFAHCATRPALPPRQPAPMPFIHRHQQQHNTTTAATPAAARPSGPGAGGHACDSHCVACAWALGFRQATPTKRGVLAAGGEPAWALSERQASRPAGRTARTTTRHCRPPPPPRPPPHANATREQALERGRGTSRPRQAHHARCLLTCLRQPAASNTHPVKLAGRFAQTPAHEARTEIADQTAP